MAIWCISVAGSVRIIRPIPICRELARHRAQAGLGTLGDLGCHLVSLAYGLMGPIDSLIADTQIIHTTRPVANSDTRAAVENEDTASAIVRFANGAQGAVHLALGLGRKNRLDWEVHGTKG